MDLAWIGRWIPKRTRYIPEQMISKLHEAEVLIWKGHSTATATKKIGAAEQTFYRWRKEYGGLQEYGGLRTDQVKCLKSLEKENAGLKRLLTDVELDKAILKEAVSGNF